MTVSTLRSYPSGARDGLQEASGRGGHVQRLLKGANALMETIDRLEKLMLSLQAIVGPSGAASAAPRAAPAPRSPSGRSL